MGYEIDFLPVGEDSKSGDAIALRYGNLFGSREEQRVIVVDGGYTETGAALMEHIRTHYKTDRVDVAISTHPDQDHISGLRELLEQMEVDQLWMHLPWNHSEGLAEGMKARWRGLSEKLQKSLAGAGDLESVARDKGIPIVEPFAGLTIDNGILTVMGPTIGFYETLLAEIREESLLSRVARRIEEAVKGWRRETLHDESLDDEGKTSPQNESSVISLFNYEGRLALLTGDAGMRALDQVVPLLEERGMALGRIGFVQVPHHGSRRNVGPSVLNRLLGSKGCQEERGSAFVSVARKGEPKHPSKKVTNAFLRRGYLVHPTKGSTKRHHHKAPDRGWTPSEPLPLYEQVEHDEDES